MNSVRITVLVLALLAAAMPMANGQETAVYDPVASYKTRYLQLYRDYLDDPNDTRTYVLLADFYADSANPMFNRALAMHYIRRAEKSFIAALQDNARYRETNRMIKAGMNIGSLRSRISSLKESTLAYLLSKPDIGDGEMAFYNDAFKEMPDMLQQLRQLKIDKAYRIARQERSVDSYYRFLELYAGTAEADTAEAFLAAWAATMMRQADSPEAVDAIAQRYSKSAAVQRTAEKRKGRLAYEAACQQHSREAYLDYLSRYPSSDDYMAALDRLDTLTIEDFHLLRKPQDYVDFIANNADSPLADKALQQLRNLIENEHDVGAAVLYLRQFPNDNNHTRIWQLLYNWHAAEGNRQPIADFALRYPDYPYQDVLREDRSQGAQIDGYSIIGNYNAKRANDYLACLRYSTGKRIAWVVIQRIMQPQLDARKWNAALKLLQQHSLPLEDACTKEIREFEQLLQAGDGEQPTALSLPANAQHPVPHPDGRRLFFSRAGKIYYIPIAVKPEGRKAKAPEATLVHVDGVDNKALVLYSFYNDGNNMLVGLAGDLCTVKRTDDSWTFEARLPEPVNSTHIETDGQMLADGSGIIFASDRPGGCNVQRSGTLFHGDTALASDLYFVPLIDGRWGDAIRLGSSINTPYCERYPAISADGNTLYYVTDGRGGMGFGDIYRATRLDDSWKRWSTPVNIGRLANSGHRESDLALSTDERRLYYISDRSGHAATYSVAVQHRNERTANDAAHPKTWSLDRVPFVADDGGQYITNVTELERLASYLLKNESISVDIESRYPGKDNAQCYSISLQRGEAVRRYLARYGISSRRVTVSAYGNADCRHKASITARLIDKPQR